MKMMILICGPNHLAESSGCKYIARSLLSVEGEKPSYVLCRNTCLEAGELTVFYVLGFRP